MKPSELWPTVDKHPTIHFVSTCAPSSASCTDQCCGYCKSHSTHVFCLQYHCEVGAKMPTTERHFTKTLHSLSAFRSLGYFIHTTIHFSTVQYSTLYTLHTYVIYVIYIQYHAKVQLRLTVDLANCLSAPLQHVCKQIILCTQALSSL